MEIIKGKYSGFCAGVSYAYNSAKEKLKEGKVYCLGKLIHNELVINELEDLNMIFVSNIKEVPDNNKVIFRAHGETVENYDYAKNHNLEVIDLTCPNVKIIHDIVRKKAKDNYIIIVGKTKHPEIIGTYSFAGNNRFIVEKKEDISTCFKDFLKSKLKSIYVVSQTTFSLNEFNRICNRIKDIFKDYNIEINITICNATAKRQKECEEISLKVDKMIIIGSVNSSNTKELYNLSKKECSNSYLIENENNLENIIFNDKDKVGVVAGASAPDWLIDKIINNISLK